MKGKLAKTGLLGISYDMVTGLTEICSLKPNL